MKDTIIFIFFLIVAAIVGVFIPKEFYTELDEHNFEL